MGIFRRKRKKSECCVEISEGLIIGRPRSMEHQNPLLSCVPKGILVFLVVFGSLGGFISAFHIDCSYGIVGIALLVSALYFSGLFAFKKSRNKDIGYILFFIVYVAGIYLFKAYVNSGFAAVVNMVRQRGEMYFDLNTGNEFAENIDNRMLTVTITIIFIGIFEVLLLNIYISNYMSLREAVFLAIPMYAIPMYFQVEPALFFVLCMLCGLMGICVFRYSGHFRNGESGKEYERLEGEKIPVISYTQNNRVYAGVLLGVLACTLVAGLFTVFFSESDFQKHYTENKYKTATREGVSGFLMIGFRIFFPNYYQQGGMSGGRLGNISALRPSNETHLIVTFAPHDTNPVYLKAYTGLLYGNDQWLDGYDLTGTEFGKSEYFRVESMEEEAKELEKIYKKDPGHFGEGVMEITNRGASPSYVYYPYFTKFDDYKKYTDNGDEFFVASDYNRAEKFTYYPNIGYEAELGEEDFSFRRLKTDSGIQVSDQEIYTMVPRQNHEAVDAFLREAGISAADSDAVEKVVDYFQKEYSYSYSPGKVPSDKDFVNYFLAENKKGICAHFASAATLVFRRLGIPARYVEGYAFGYGKVLSSPECPELEYEDFYRGYSELDKKSVVAVEVTDANAHAWVEIYQKGRGWVVVDPTPSVSEEDAGARQSVWNSVTNFWENSPDISLDGSFSGFNLNFLNSNGFRMALLLAGVLLVLVFIGRLVVIRIYHYSRWHTRSFRKNLLWYYGELCRRKGKRNQEFARLSVPSEQIAYLAEKYGQNHKEEMDAERLIRVLEEICFGPEAPGEEDYKYVMKMLKKF